MKENKQTPPRLFLLFFHWYCDPKLMQYIEGDLQELYQERVTEKGKRKADILFMIDVLLLFRPGIIRRRHQNHHLKPNFMFSNYFKFGWRKLLRSKGYSLINIGGLAIGMTVAIFIGLWIHDELSFNKYHKNYNHIGQVWGGGVNPETSEIDGFYAMQYPVGTVLRDNYPQFFKHVLMAWGIGDYTLASGNKKFNQKGLFIEGGVLEMLSLKMLKGSYGSLDEANSVVLSESAAESIFGDEDPINKRLQIDSRMEVEVTGVYKDIPRNNRFSEVQFFAPWSLFVASNDWTKNSVNDWDNRPFNIYVQLQPNSNFETVNAVIKDLYYKNVPADFFKMIERNKPFLQVIPMSTWHLYSEFKDGKPAEGRITYVWLFGIVGIFVLLLACINFINLSTARSQERAREVGVRKAIGSGKSELIAQFLTESFLVVMLSFVCSVVLVIVLQKAFNDLADKDIVLPFGNPFFWVLTILFLFLTGLLSGMYPAFYLSSFQPVKVLKGILRTGRLALLPRKILVVTQFTVSVVLIIGTLIIYKQIQHSRNRPIGYSRESLIMMELSDPNFKDRQDVLRNELLNTGVVYSMATSSSPLTAIWNTTNGYEWVGKDPGLDAEFAICNVTPEFGKTVGWEIIEGRDFSKDLPTDTTESIIINEAAAKYMGLKNAVGQQLTDVDEFGKPKWTRTIIGVVKNMVMESPYDQVRQTIYYFNKNALNILHVRINPAVSASIALPKIQEAIEKVAPSALFDYKFVDEEYARKFSQEVRIGKLSGVFSVLAIFISCMGIFGLASFVASQRTKEIGIRKVLGASVINLWRMLSKDFVILVLVSCFIAIPIGYYLMHNWLEKFEYRTEISWWIFLVTCIAAVAITILTVSFQAIKAAMMNPVKSLKSE
jgi:predicted permease